MGFKSAGGIALSYVLMSVIRVVQLALALAVCGLYGVDLQAARNAGKNVDGRWAFAVVVGSFSAVTAVVYMVPFVMQIHVLFVWDALLFFFWVVLFGIFGNMYIKENAEGDAGVQRMKNAVWVDLVNMLLWLITAVVMLCIFFKHRGGDRSRFTGRARTGV